MVPQESQLVEQDSFDYAVAKVTKKDTIFKKDSSRAASSSNAA